ncbi:hypothetical protein WJX73_001112 [Symbiochloris irregularis]|uniref:threonine ammonia-lyase n=1 Tax=Symbiochloris irregularis TaxID=706552 RepID=A0AAW1PQY4_9CHLO
MSRCAQPECEGPAGCTQMLWRKAPGGYLRETLTATVYDVAVNSPLQLATELSEAFENELLLKREDLQAVHSFKLRGAYNKMANLTEEVRQRGIICSSAGNHAQGVALAARRLGCKATICMPLAAPAIKIAAVERLGGEVQLVGETYTETEVYAKERAMLEGRAFVAPYDDPYTIAGQGTIGIGAYVKALKPEVKIFGAECTGANAMAQSLARGHRVRLTKADAFADGIAVKQVGAETFRLCRQVVDGVVLVDNAATSAAIRDVFNETRSILEPAGAVGVAGAKAYMKHYGLKDKTVVVVTSGANMNFDRLRLVAELAGVGAKSEAMLVTTIPERPGAFHAFADAALMQTDIQVTEFKYRYAAGSEAHILWSAETASLGDSAAMVDRLNAVDLPTRDISAIEPAQVHLRHLVGGRARSFTGALPFERIFQVDFPERPGALRRFLSQVSPQWNLTLFHYRKTGNTSTGILIGMQVPPETSEAFAAAQAALGDDFVFSELHGDARQVFDMFIS